jgi:hypothetical protein
MASTTLPTSKSTFLSSQIRLLSTPLAPSSEFTSTYIGTSNPRKRKAPSDNVDASNITTDTNNTTISTATNDTEQDDDTNTASHNDARRAEPTITPKQVEDFMAKVNARISTHNKKAFPSLTQRLIVEQIEGLYLDTALGQYALDEDQGSGDGFANGTAVRKDADLTSTAVVSALPEGLEGTMLGPNNLSAGEHRQRRQRYTLLLRQLQALSSQRDELQRKYDRYKKLQTLLQPFSDPKENVQPNLIGMSRPSAGTEGEGLAREMERVRVLVARVLGGMEGKSNDEIRTLVASGKESVAEDATEGVTVREGQRKGTGTTGEERLRLILEMGIQR